MHFARSTEATPLLIPAHVPAILTPTGFVGITPGGEEFLLSYGEKELVTALCANERFVLKRH